VAVRKRIRKRIAYKPTWEGTFENYSRSWVKKNFWRVRHMHGSEEDSLQECAVVFARCANTYRGKLDNPAWFMSIYKIALVNQFNVHAVHDGRTRTLDVSDGVMLEGPSQDPNLGPLSVKLRAVGDELLGALRILANAPHEALSIMMSAPTEITRGRAIARFTGAHDPFARAAITAYAKLRLEAPAEARVALSHLSDILREELTWEPGIEGT
jgi:hypothetical protein